MTKINNWAYKFSLNHDGAGVGDIYYKEDYFKRENIVNPASGKPYTKEEIKVIVDNATEVNKSYIKDTPSNALIGISVINTSQVYWYDLDNSNKILSSANPLILNPENGTMFDTDNNLVASPLK